jgi:hypothetical protein
MSLHASTPHRIDLDALDAAATRLDFDECSTILMMPLNDAMAEVTREFESKGLKPTGRFKATIIFKAEAE